MCASVSSDPQDAFVANKQTSSNSSGDCTLYNNGISLLFLLLLDLSSFWSHFFSLFWKTKQKKKMKTKKMKQNTNRNLFDLVWQAHILCIAPWKFRLDCNVFRFWLFLSILRAFLPSFVAASSLRRCSHSFDLNLLRTKCCGRWFSKQINGYLYKQRVKRVLFLSFFRSRFYNSHREKKSTESNALAQSDVLFSFILYFWDVNIYKRTLFDEMKIDRRV